MTRVERKHALYDLPRTKIMKDKHLEWRQLFYFTQLKKSEAVETGCNNVLEATLFLVVNNIFPFPRES